MDKKSMLNAAIIFLSLIASTPEALFFAYPKKSLVDFFHSIKEKKENLKKTLHRDEVHHYHLHYYPIPVRIIYDHSFSRPPFIAPGKSELDHIHRQKLRSLGWTSSECEHVPWPKIIAAQRSQNLDRSIENHDNENDQFTDPSHSLTEEDQIDLAEIRHRFDDRDNHRQDSQDRRKDYHHYYYPSEIPSFDPPFRLHREIVIRPASSPPLNDGVVENEGEQKSLPNKLNPIIGFFQNLHRGIKNSIFHNTEDDDDNEDDHRDRRTSILQHDRGDKIDRGNDEDDTHRTVIDSNTDATNVYALLNLDREKLWKFRV